MDLQVFNCMPFVSMHASRIWPVYDLSNLLEVRQNIKQQIAAQIKKERVNLGEERS
jgi:hypothetical protein